MTTKKPTTKDTKSTKEESPLRVLRDLRGESSSPYFLPYQEKWLTDEAPFKLYEKSRRIGATYATSYRCFQKCLRRRDFTQWVSSRDLLTAKEFITDYVARWC